MTTRWYDGQRQGTYDVRLPDPEKTSTVLIGTSRYSNLPDLPPVRTNLDDLLETLTDPRVCGLVRERCAVVADTAHLQRVFRTVSEHAAAAEDTLLVYFAGHGLIGDHGELFLALRDTDENELPVTAFRYDVLRDIVRDSPARNRVVILDCCFSGLAANPMAGKDNALPGMLDIAGTYVLTSTLANQISTAPEGEPHTTFTGELLRLLTSGVPDGPELLTLNDIFIQLLTSAKAHGLPKPNRRGTGTADLLALSRNLAWQAAPGDSPPVMPRPVARKTVSRKQAFGVLAGAGVLAAATTLAVRGIDAPDSTPHAAAPDELPLEVLEVTAFRSTSQSPFFVLPEPVSMTDEVARSFSDSIASQSDEFASWYAEHSGVAAIDAGFTNVTMRGAADEAVRVTGMEVVKDCGAPLDGTAMVGYTQGGGEDSIAVGFDLDSPAPIPQQMADTIRGLVGTGNNYFAAKTVVVEPGEKLTLSLGAFTKRQSCTFTFRLLVATDDGTVTQDIDNNGKAFSVTAKAAPMNPEMPLSGYQAVYVQDDSLVWQPVDPASYTSE